MLMGSRRQPEFLQAANAPTSSTPPAWAVSPSGCVASWRSCAKSVPVRRCERHRPPYAPQREDKREDRLGLGLDLTGARCDLRVESYERPGKGKCRLDMVRMF